MKTTKRKRTVKLVAVAKKEGAKERELMDGVSRFLAALADRNRLRIMYLVRKDALTVTQIYEALGITQNLTSHHIGQLKKAGLLSERREGTFRFYTIDGKQLAKYGKELAQLLEIK